MKPLLRQVFINLSDICSTKPCWKLMLVVLLLGLHGFNVHCNIVFTRLNDVTNKSCPDTFSLMTSTAIYKKTQCASLCTRDARCQAFVSNVVTGTCQTKSRSTRLSGTCTEETGTVHYGKLRAGCPVGFSWHEGARMCYKLFASCGNWSASREQCRLVATDLLVLSDPELLSFIQGLVGNVVDGGLCDTKADLWVGATDLAGEGEWVWVDGTQVTGGMWGTGEPGGGTWENCLSLMKLYNFAGNDENCDIILPFACGIAM